jgi:hypothetical protein
VCGVIAARRLGAEQIIIMGRHPDRITLAREFGATDVVTEPRRPARRDLSSGAPEADVDAVEEMVMRRRTRRSMARALAAIALTGATGTSGQAAAQAVPNRQVRTMRIRIDIEGTTMTGTLEQSAAARDFAALLPLTLTLRDYAATEKISDLPRRLSTQGAPPGFDPSVGDIAYYAPWGNLAIFYRDFGYSIGLIKLGAIESGGAALNRPGSLRARIELVGDAR